MKIYYRDTNEHKPFEWKQKHTSKEFVCVRLLVYKKLYTYINNIHLLRKRKAREGDRELKRVSYSSNILNI